jgi:hypothetical protein
VEGLETRVVPALGLGTAFVVPVSQPLTDSFHFHSLADALQAIAATGTVTIEAGATPDAGGVTVATEGITIQGDPNVPASILPLEQIRVAARNITLTNLNLSSLKLGETPGDPSISGNQVTKCIINTLTENGVQSTFTQNTITGSALFNGVLSVLNNVNNDTIANNVFSSNNSSVSTLEISNCDGAFVIQNTFYSDSGNVIDMTHSGEDLPVGNGFVNERCRIANNTISGQTPGANGISVFQSLATVLNNSISTNGGRGLFLGSDLASHMQVEVQGNDFHGNAVGVLINGDGMDAGIIDLGGGALGSLGGNNFRSLSGTGPFFAAATLSAGAIALSGTSSTAVVWASGNIFQSGISPNVQVDSATQGSATGTGQINADTLDSGHAFVQTLYNEVLGRTGTSSELDPWVQLLNTGGQAAVANGILHSSEALGRIVDQFYLRFLGRQSDPTGRAGWIGFLQNGGTEEQIESLFLTSPEYISHINVDYVQSLYMNILGRTGSADELALWNNNIQSLGLTGVANGFVHSTENRLNTARSDFQMFLHRTPTNTELAPLANGSLDLLSLEGVVLSSAEFFGNG